MFVPPDDVQLQRKREGFTDVVYVLHETLNLVCLEIIGYLIIELIVLNSLYRLAFEYLRINFLFRQFSVHGQYTQGYKSTERQHIYLLLN